MNFLLPIICIIAFLIGSTLSIITYLSDHDVAFAVMGTISTLAFASLLIVGCCYSASDTNMDIEKGKYYEYMYKITNHEVNDITDLQNIKKYNQDLSKNQDNSNDLFVGFLYVIYKDLDYIDYNDAERIFVENHKGKE